MRPNKGTVTWLEYCQYLLSSQINYTLTNFADHTEKFSHDAINRYLEEERITPHLVWARLKKVAQDAQKTIYQVKHGLLSDYLHNQLRSPSVAMVLA